MRLNFWVTASILVAALHGNLYAAEQSGVRRTDLESHDVPGSNYRVVTTFVEIEPGAAADFYTHPGNIRSDMCANCAPFGQSFDLEIGL